jgi:hypothetical protein
MHDSSKIQEILNTKLAIGLVIVFPWVSIANVIASGPNALPDEL